LGTRLLYFLLCFPGRFFLVSFTKLLTPMRDLRLAI